MSKGDKRKKKAAKVKPAAAEPSRALTWKEYKRESEEAAARFESEAVLEHVVGHPVAEAQQWCRAHGFGVTVEPYDSPSGLSWSLGRVRLRVHDGIVVDAFHG